MERMGEENNDACRAGQGGKIQEGDRGGAKCRREKKAKSATARHRSDPIFYRSKEDRQRVEGKQIGFGRQGDINNVATVVLAAFRAAAGHPSNFHGSDTATLPKSTVPLPTKCLHVPNFLPLSSD